MMDYGGRLWKLKLYLWLVPCDIAHDIFVWALCLVFGHDWDMFTASNAQGEKYKIMVCRRCYRTPKECGFSDFDRYGV